MTTQNLREEELREALDCGDNSCYFAKDKTGMRTNGGCRCFSNAGFSKSLVAAAIQMLPKYLALTEHVEELENEIKKLKAEPHRIQTEMTELNRKLRIMGVSIREATVEDYQKEVSELEEQLAEKDAEIEGLKGEAMLQQVHYSDKLKEFKSGYESKLADLEALVVAQNKVLHDVRDMVNEQECREDEDCDHCLIVHHVIDPALSLCPAKISARARAVEKVLEAAEEYRNAFYTSSAELRQGDLFECVEALEALKKLETK